MTGQLAWVAPGEVPGRLSPYSHWWQSQVHRFQGGPACVLDLHFQNGQLTCACRAPHEHPARGPVADDELDEIVRMLDGCAVCTGLPLDVVNHQVKQEGWAVDEANGKVVAGNALAGQTIVAVIDDGIGFANERFRKPSDGMQTRFDYLWLQGAPRKPGVKPGDLPFGREFERADIDKLLTKHRIAGAEVDELALYRAAGLIDFSRREVQSAASMASHGTGVLDRAAGASPWKDPEGPVLMGVALPSQITQDTTGLFLDYFVILAIQRILQRARWLGRKPPKVVINLSYSLTAGPLDGSTPIDRFVAATKAKQLQEFDLVVPAGNHRLSQTHAELKCAAGALSEPLTWRVLPDDRTPSFVEIWSRRVDSRPTDPTIRCQLTPPGGPEDNTAPKSVAFDHFLDLQRNGNGAEPLARIYYSWHPQTYERDQTQGRERIVIALQPTVADAPGQPSAPAGDWTIRIWSDRDATADLRVQRDDTPLGYRLRGRQSCFNDARYEVYEGSGRVKERDLPVRPNGASPVKRDGTLNSIATDETNIRMIGAYTEREHEERKLGLREHDLLPYSGLGPAGARKGPDANGPVGPSRLHPGVIVSGTLSGSRVIRTGTSFAAPVATRWLTRPAGAKGAELLPHLPEPNDDGRPRRIEGDPEAIGGADSPGRNPWSTVMLAVMAVLVLAAAAGALWAR